MTSPMLPKNVRIVEVGPRDGLQSQPKTFPTPVKAEFIRLLVDAGLADIEATSFSHPERIPQLADAEALLALLERRPGVHISAVVPNLRGLERAIACGASRIGVLTAASETFNRRNINMGIRASIDAIRSIVARAAEHGISARAYISTAWVCPYEGAVDATTVVGLAEELLAIGVDEVSIGDTIGAATPDKVEATIAALLKSCPAESLAVHFHDTYGLAIANAYQALRMGIVTFDSSAGGLGGCPYAPGAMGNVATEDLLYLFDRLGVESGVRLGGIRRASEFMAGKLGRALPSRVLATAAGTDGASVGREENS